MLIMGGRFLEKIQLSRRSIAGYATETRLDFIKNMPDTDII